MSEQDAGRGPEHFALEQVAAYEPERLDLLKPAEAACEEKCGPEDEDDSTVEDDSDVMPADEDEPSDHSGQYEV